MDIVIDASLVVKARWLPELANVCTSVIIVKQVLGEESYQVEAYCVGLCSREEASKVAVVFGVTFVEEHLFGAVPAVVVGHGAIR